MKVTKPHLSMVVSYATRPMREGETNGVEHWFITNEEADKLLADKDNVIAYTEIGDKRYFTTTECFDKDNVYIIDPKGIEYMKEHLKDKVIKVIYVYAPDKVREARAKTRSDSLETFYKRSADENEQFTNFELTHAHYDLFINNKDDDLQYSVERVVDFIRRTYTEDTLYLIVGRTCSGKDTITRNVLHLMG